MARLAERLKGAVIGDPMDPETSFGPMVSEAQMRIVESYIDKGQTEGARLVTGGKQLDRDGYYLPPSVFADVTDDMTITTRALKQEVVHVPSPAGFDYSDAGIVVSDSDISCYSRPEQGNHILIGSEDPECDPREFVDPDTYDQNFSEQWTTQAYRYAQRVPELGIPSRMAGVVDLYDVTEDWIPIYDRSSLNGYYMACGSSGNQFKNAPIAGKLMAALVDYCESGNDHDANPLQFDLPYIGRSIDVSHYSRKREINPDSSFSVLG